MFLVSGSVTSLVAGLVSGLLAAIAAYLASQNPKNVWVSLGEQVYVVSAVIVQQQVFVFFLTHDTVTTVPPLM